MSIRRSALFKDLCEDLDNYLESMGSSFRASTLVPGPGLPTPVLSELTVKEFACKQLIETFFKKFEDGHSARANAAALDKFIASNIRCGEWSLKDDRTLEEDLLLGLFKQEIYRFFYPKGRSGHILDDSTKLFHKGDVGPGASVGANGSDFYTKMFSSTLTTTSFGLALMFEHSLQNVPYWQDAENQRRSEFGDYEKVKGNRLSFVPKNVDTARCICTEPLLNMFFQQGVKCVLEDRLSKYFGIDLSIQQICNKQLAQIGSLSERFATIDLSSASDSVSLKMIEETFPRDVVTWLSLFRSPEVQLPDGSWMELKMISSMGNAYTFPLETLIFSCVVSAAYQLKNYKLRRGYGEYFEFSPETSAFSVTTRLPNFGVFGDDIIVKSELYRQTVLLLNLLGFEVNAEKSFCQGPFRESCGGDYFLGHPVRGVYIKTLKTQASRYVAINRLNEWSSHHGIPLQSTIQRLLKSVRFIPVPLDESYDAGIRVPYDLLSEESRKHHMWTDGNGTIHYKRWAVSQKRMRISDGHIYKPKGAKYRSYNESGLLLAFLRGDVRNSTLGSRLGALRYRSKDAVTLSWDHCAPAADLASAYGSRLKNAIYINVINV